MGFELPKFAKPYTDHAAVARLETLKSFLDAMQEGRQKNITWTPASEAWFDNARYCESSLTPNGEMFRGTKHPKLDGVEYYEAVWVRENMSTPTAALIFFPYPGHPDDKPQIFTIGVYNKEWMDQVIDSYAWEVRNRAI